MEYIGGKAEADITDSSGDENPDAEISRSPLKSHNWDLLSIALCAHFALPSWLKRRPRV